MLKVLIKKQFSELSALFFRGGKKGKQRTTAGITGLAILYGFLYICFFFAFFGMSALFSHAFFALGLKSLYFSLMGIMSVILGVVGAAFSTYTTLYLPKDNQLLLSLPISPSNILLSRMVTVYFLGAIYSSTAFLPACIRYWTEVRCGKKEIVLPIAVFILITFFVLVFVCVLGFLIALIAMRLKNKAVMTVILSVFLIAVYYFFYFRFNAFLQVIAKDPQKTGRVFDKYLFISSRLGRAAAGDLVSFAIYFLIVAALCAVCLFVLSKTFIKITTFNKGEKKTVYKEQPQKATTPEKALLNREFKHFLSSPAYMMNSGLGLIILPVGALFALYKSGDLREAIKLLPTLIPEVAYIFENLIPVAACLVIMLVLSMNAFSAPSVSLEGKHLWIVRSLPVETKKIFEAKLKMHRYLNMVPAAIGCLCLGLAVNASPSVICVSAVCLMGFIRLTAAAGLALNLKKPNLTWTSETVPIKQSMSVAVTLFGGWAVAIILGVVYYFIAKKVSPEMYLFIAAILFFWAERYIIKWINSEGVKLFEKL